MNICSMDTQRKLVALIDMDCFYCQVEMKLNPSLQGKPLAVVQYNTWKGGGIIAVNYEARSSGVTRHMRGEDAQKQCPQIELVSVPEVRGKADLSKYRNASREVMAVLCEFCTCVEKASIDEAYLDLTDTVQKTNERITIDKLKSTYVVGYNSDCDGTKQWLSDVYMDGINDSNIFNLAQAASLVEEIRAAIFNKTGFHCSAGISHNKGFYHLKSIEQGNEKVLLNFYCHVSGTRDGLITTEKLPRYPALILAKLACGLHKPKCQTVLPLTSVPILYEQLPLKKIRNLGGKFGDAVKEQLNVTTVGQVLKYSLNDLQQKFGCKSGSWLYNIARGIDFETVKVRTIAKSIGCCKNFKGHMALTTKKDVEHWLKELCMEIYDRVQDDLIMNKRRATLLTVSAHQVSRNSNAFSRSTPLNSYATDEMMKNSIAILCKSNCASAESGSWFPPLKFLGLSVGKFVNVADSNSSLLNFFKPLHGIWKCTAQQSPYSAIKLENKAMQSRFSDNNFVGNNIATVESNNLPNVDLDDAENLDYSNSFFCKYFGSLKPLSPIATYNSIKYINVNSTICDVDNDQASKEVINEIKDEPVYSPRFPLNTEFENNEKANSRAKCSVTNATAFKIPVVDHQNLNQVFEISAAAKKLLEKQNSDNRCGRIENEFVEYCNQCDRLIPLEIFLEHLDYHAAHKLHEQLNTPNNVLRSNDHHKSPSPRSHNILVPCISKHSDKRKSKKSAFGSRPNLTKKNHSITTFFHFKQL